MIHFLLNECTFLRYFVPIIIAANKRDVESRMYVATIDKYTGPQRSMNKIVALAKEYKFDAVSIEELAYAKGAVITVEGVGKQFINNKIQTSFALTWLADFTSLMGGYENIVDYIVFPTKFMADVYDVKQTPKHLYLGSSKFDVELNSDQILTKYSIPSTRNALVVFPKLRDLHMVDMPKIYDYLRRMGYIVLVKARGKDPAAGAQCGDMYFQDASWFPHDTMELASVSDFVVNFDSTVIEECTLLSKKIVNFHIKPKEPHFGFAFKQSYVEQMKPNIEFNDFEQKVNNLLARDCTESFKQTQMQFNIPGNASDRLLDFLDKKELL